MTHRRERRAAFLDEIDQATEQLKFGALPSSVRLNALGMNKGEVDRELAAAVRELAVADADARRTAERLRGEQFKAAMANAQRLRTEIVDLIQQTSVKLGEWYEVRKQANALANRAQGVWPHELSALREACELIDPYADREWCGDRTSGGGAVLRDLLGVAAQDGEDHRDRADDKCPGRSAHVL